jgi:hypothetical protein
VDRGEVIFETTAGWVRMDGEIFQSYNIKQQGYTTWMALYLAFFNKFK